MRNGSRSRWLLFVFAALLAFVASAKMHRNLSQRLAFQKARLCPATGKWPGYVVDHVVPLCTGRKDRPSNMQWQTLEEAKKAVSGAV